MSWKPLDFGKRPGQTLPRVLCSEPSYFFWLIRERALYDRSFPRASELDWKSTHIIVPNDVDGHAMRVNYGWDRQDGRLVHVEAVRADDAPHDGSTRTTSRPWLDLSLASGVRRADSHGEKLLLTFLRREVLGVRRIPTSLAESFFDDDANFDMSGYDRIGALVRNSR